MKYVLLSIFVFFAAQPLQASFCDMHGSQGTTQGQHGNMPGGEMPGMDCCDSNPVDSSDSCNSMSHCGACTAAAVAVGNSILNPAFNTGTHNYFSDTGEPLIRFHSPPFRPPIA